jgi:hypothetical protein
MENVIGFLIGWPSLVLGLCLAVGGAWLKKPALLWIALVLSAPIGFTERQTPAEAGV